MIYDINLIPKNDKKKSGSTTPMLITIGICSLLCFGLFGYYLPISEQWRLKSQIKEQEKQITEYVKTDEQFRKLTKQVCDETEKVAMLAALKSNSFKMSKIMDDIQTNIPKNINVNAITYQDGLLTIEAYSPTYKEIAQFIVNARKIENVQNIKFTSASKEDVDQGKKSKEMNRFTIYLNLKMQDAYAKLTSKQDQTANGTTAADNTNSGKPENEPANQAGTSGGEAGSNEVN
jgi:Tfp pilus assembly protein PilN